MYSAGQMRSWSLDGGETKRGGFQVGLPWRRREATADLDDPVSVAAAALALTGEVLDAEEGVICEHASLESAQAVSDNAEELLSQAQRAEDASDTQLAQALYARSVEMLLAATRMDGAEAHTAQLRERAEYAAGRGKKLDGPPARNAYLLVSSRGLELISACSHRVLSSRRLFHVPRASGWVGSRPSFTAAGPRSASAPWERGHHPFGEEPRMA